MILAISELVLSTCMSIKDDVLVDGRRTQLRAMWALCFVFDSVRKEKDKAGTNWFLINCATFQLNGFLIPLSRCRRRQNYLSPPSTTITTFIAAGQEQGKDWSRCRPIIPPSSVRILEILITLFSPVQADRKIRVGRDVFSPAVYPIGIIA